MVWYVENAYSSLLMGKKYIIGHENLKHIHGPTLKFRYESNKWVPYAVPVNLKDQEYALKNMQSLKYYFNKNKVQEMILERIDFWKNLRIIVDSKDSNKVYKYLKNNENFQLSLDWPEVQLDYEITTEMFKEAVTRDLAKILDTNFLDYNLRIDLSELGYNQILSE